MAPSRTRETTSVTSAGRAERFRAPSENLAKAKQRLALAEKDHIERPRIMPHPKLMTERRRVWTAFLAEADIPQELYDWAERMALRSGSATVAVGAFHASLPWIVALMVIRYGEALDTNVGEPVLDDKGKVIAPGDVMPEGRTRPFWPSVLGEEDVARALSWEEGNIPAGIVIVSAELTDNPGSLSTIGGPS